jgi:hypothetical protein
MQATSSKSIANAGQGHSYSTEAIQTASAASPVSIETEEEEEEEEDSASLHWKILWCQAFPFLFVPSTNVSLLSWYNDVGKEEKGNDSVPYSHAQAQILIPLALIAYYSIFPHKSTRSSYYHKTTRRILHSNEQRYFNYENHSNNLQYGEILPHTIFSILNLLLQPHHQDQQGVPTTNFNSTMLKNVVDIGSGDGTLLLAMSILHPFHNAVGIEIVPSRHEEALQNLKLWNTHHRYCSSSNINTTSFTFLLQDFKLPSTFTDQILCDANIVVVHATAFDEALLACIEQRLAEQCASGTWFVMVSKPLGRRCGNKIKDNARDIFPCWKILHHGWMDWGCGTIFIQRKV